MRGSFKSAALTACLVMAAPLALVGCTEHHDEPWINPGQADRIGGLDQRDEETQQQLRDRMRSIQSQR